MNANDYSNEEILRCSFFPAILTKLTGLVQAYLSTQTKCMGKLSTAKDCLAFRLEWKLESETEESDSQVKALPRSGDKA